MAHISKTDYLLWRQCPKNAWLKIHKPHVYYAAEMTDFERSLLDAGIEVEIAARGLFPDGKLMPSPAALGRTSAEFLGTNRQTLFQTVFENNGMLAAVDVLEFDQ